MLKAIIAFSVMLFTATVGAAQTTADSPTLDRWTEDRLQVFDAVSVNLNDFVWIARPVVVFADNPNDPQFQRQMELLTQRFSELAERDVILIADTDPANPSAVRTTLRPRGFMLALLDKDGRVVLRKPSPWDVRELTRWIDKSPTRIQEVRERREAGTVVPGISN